MARFTLGLSPYALWLAAADWAIHLSASPGKWQQLTEKAAQENIEFLIHLSRLPSNPDCPPCVEPLLQDYRFRNEEWQRLPFKLFYQAFLADRAVVAERPPGLAVCPLIMSRFGVHGEAASRCRFTGKFHSNQP